MEFYKIVGSGNDFILVDNRKGRIARKADLARKMCHRKFGVGADGLILVEDSKKADFRMRIFNPDGSEAEMCGNGLRCLTRFLAENKITRKPDFKIETGAGLHQVATRGEQIKVQIQVAGAARLNLAIPLGRTRITGHFINTGVPHTVMVVPAVAKVDVAGIGPAIRYHRLFRPRGTNVNWIQIVSGHRITIRTYERGVEAETLSCGTGAVAGALVGFALGKLASPVAVETASGELLRVYFSTDLKEIFLEGKATHPYSGVWLARR